MKTIKIYAALLTIFLAGAFYNACGEEIKVPVLFRHKASPKFKGAQITGGGIYMGKDKIVWAIEVANMKEFMDAPNTSIGFYSDIDGNKATGRFPNIAGWDFQINLDLERMTLSVTRWFGNKKSKGVPLYIDDYYMEVKNNILYFAIRKEPLSEIVFSDKPTFRVIGNSVTVPFRRIDERVDLKKSYGTFDPPLNFVRFGGGRVREKKISEAVLIPRKDGLKVWNTYGERYQEKEKMPKVVATEKALKSSAAKGEQENIFFAVTDNKPLTSLVITPTPLKDGKGNTIKAASVKYMGFVGDLREEYHTDILYPQFVKSMSLNNFVAVRVNTPRNVPAGIYKGELKLSVNGKEVESIPWEHEVYDFEMPDRPFFKTAYCIKPAFMQRIFKKMTGKEAKAESKAQQKLAKEYRFSPRLITGRGAARPKKWENNTWKIDWSKFDKTLDQYFNKDKFTVFQDAIFQMGSHGTPYPRVVEDLKLNTEEFDTRMGELAKNIYEHYKKLGILDKVFFVFWDEPYGSVYPYIKQAIIAAKKKAPEMEAGVFISHAAPELANEVDIYLTPFSSAARIRMTPATAKKKIWAYNNVGMGSFSTPASMLRAFYHTAYKYNIEGYLYSEINVYNSNDGMKRKDIPYNTWTNHNWFYPGKKPGEPMPSLRMELTRDGLDDYDYIILCKKAAGTLPRFLTEKFPVMDINGFVKYPVKSNREMQKLRHRLAQEIVKHSGKK